MSLLNHQLPVWSLWVWGAQWVWPHGIPTRGRVFPVDNWYMPYVPWRILISSSGDSARIPRATQTKINADLILTNADLILTLWEETTIVDERRHSDTLGGQSWTRGGIGAVGRACAPLARNATLFTLKRHGAVHTARTGGGEAGGARRGHWWRWRRAVPAGEALEAAAKCWVAPQAGQCCVHTARFEVVGRPRRAGRRGVALVGGRSKGGQCLFFCHRQTRLWDMLF
eukprot:Polyplicarium_translucidae@DN1905_c0_g1_i1.p1